MKKCKIITVFFLLCLVSIMILACKNKETEAREMLNKAITLKVEGHALASKAVYEILTEKYPETVSATEANEELLRLKTINILFGKSKITTYMEIIEIVLDLYRLDNDTYPSTKGGLKSLIENADNSKLWDGPYFPDAATAFVMIEYYSYTKENKSDYFLYRK